MKRNEKPLYYLGEVGTFKSFLTLLNLDPVYICNILIKARPCGPK